MSQGPVRAAPVRADLLRWLPVIAITAAIAILVTLVIRSNELLEDANALVLRP